MPDQAQPAKQFVVVRGETSADHALDGAVVAIGNFDGVHRGHRAVIGAALARAKTLSRPAAALTFEPHPRSFFQPAAALFRLTDERAKLRLLAATGLSGAIVLHFDAALAGLSAHDFIARILVSRFAVAGVAIGFDFHFGPNRAGSPGYLAAEGAKLGFAVDIVPRFEDAGGPVRSGPIRAALPPARLRKRHSRASLVRERKASTAAGAAALGYPTANLRLDPACGLKHGTTRCGSARASAAMMASRASAAPDVRCRHRVLEVFLFDSGDLYGEMIDVAFVDWIRPELKFETSRTSCADA
jgi:riboflavin kinase/FMN adenylyltransferase